MSAYIIASYDISDDAGYEPYVPGIIPLLQKHNLKSSSPATRRRGSKVRHAE